MSMILLLYKCTQQVYIPDSAIASPTRRRGRIRGAGSISLVGFFTRCINHTEKLWGAFCSKNQLCYNDIYKSATNLHACTCKSVYRVIKNYCAYVHSRVPNGRKRIVKFSTLMCQHISHHLPRLTRSTLHYITACHCPVTCNPIITFLSITVVPVIIPSSTLQSPHRCIYFSQERPLHHHHFEHD